MFSNKPSNASISAVDRRQRENDARRLTDVLPQLLELSIYVDEHSSIAAPKYVRRIVVGSAPALFIIPCSDPNCAEGGHDVTAEVLKSLSSHRMTFDGTHICSGWIGGRQCNRTMWYRCEAIYVTA